MDTAFTPHPCSILGQSTCTGAACSAPNVTSGTCDQAGCDFNAYRMGVTTFFGPGANFAVNTQQKFTVVTQFVGSPITEIKRFFVQNGVVIANANSAIPGVTGNSVSDTFCAAQKTAFGDTNTFSTKGGMSGISQSASAGMVLVMSLWDDHAADMLWLDSVYPPGENPAQPGISRGACATTSGQPTQVESQSPNAQVIYSNIKFGPLGSTFNQGGVTSISSGTGTTGPTTSSNPTTTVSSSAPTGTGVSPIFGQCGGINWTGATVCAAGSTCTVENPFFFQCVPS